MDELSSVVTRVPDGAPCELPPSASVVAPTCASSKTAMPRNQLSDGNPPYSAETVSDESETVETPAQTEVAHISNADAGTDSSNSNVTPVAVGRSEKSPNVESAANTTIRSPTATSMSRFFGVVEFPSVYVSLSVGISSP